MTPLSAAAAIILAATLTPLPRQNIDIPYPTRDWPTGKPRGADEATIARLMTVTEAIDPELGETRAIVVVQHGVIVAERYAPDITADTRLVSWSMAKSITQALVGIAVGDGSVDIDKPMGNPLWRTDDTRAAVTWRQWLDMTDGLAYREMRAGPTTNDAAKMTFGEGRHDVIAYAASLPLAHPPGEVWNYNSAGTNLVAHALGRVIAPSARTPSERRGAMLAFMKTRLFDVLGMRSAQPEFDPQGTFIGGSLVYATARDFAKFGLLYLRDGVWEGKRVLPEGWVDFARTKSPAKDIDTYGAGWWIAAAEGQGDPYEALTLGPWRDAFSAEGHRGQLIVVVPSKDLVIVRLGKLAGEGMWGALGRFTDAMIGAFPNATGP
jgi:CubicO group peptidase (beta-lactamase class C family)